MTNRNKNLQFAYTLAIGVVFLLSSSRAFATNDENHIQEIMAGVNGNSKIQFIVIKQEGGGNLWGPQAGETQSRVMLVFFDAAGRETGKFKFPHSVPARCQPAVDCDPGLCEPAWSTDSRFHYAAAPEPHWREGVLHEQSAESQCVSTNRLRFLRELSCCPDRN